MNALVINAAAQTALTGKWKFTGYNFTVQMAFPVEKMDVNLTIESDMRISGKAGCNSYSGKLAMEKDGKINIGPLTSTDMACDEMTGQFESLFLQTLENATLYTLKNGVLTLTDPGTKSFLRFARDRGKTVATTRQILYIGSKMGNCRGARPMKCLRIKNAKGDAWQNLYDSIIGFKFKPGKFYKIEVTKETLPGGPPQDSSNLEYKFVRIIKSVKTEKYLYN